MNACCGVYRVTDSCLTNCFGKIQEAILVTFMVRENLWVSERSQSNLPASNRVFLPFKVLPIPQVKGITPWRVRCSLVLSKSGTDSYSVT